MLIDLRSKDKPTRTTPEQSARRIARAKLSCMTIRALGDFAREHGISLAAAPTKQDMVDEVMRHYGKSWGPRKEGNGKAD